MSRKNDNNHDQIPRPVLYAAAALVVLTITLSAFGRYTGVGVSSTPEATVVATRDLLFTDRTDGSILVTDADSGQVAYIAEPGTNGFLRGVMRGIARIRKLEKISPEIPYRLVQWHNGRLSIVDPATGWDVKLELFGPDNYGVFVRMMDRKFAQLEDQARIPERSTR